MVREYLEKIENPYLTEAEKDTINNLYLDDKSLSKEKINEIINKRIIDNKRRLDKINLKIKNKINKPFYIEQSEIHRPLHIIVKLEDMLALRKELKIEDDSLEKFKDGNDYGFVISIDNELYYITPISKEKEDIVIRKYKGFNTDTVISNLKDTNISSNIILKRKKTIITASSDELNKTPHNKIVENIVNRYLTQNKNHKKLIVKELNNLINMNQEDIINRLEEIVKEEKVVKANGFMHKELLSLLLVILLCALFVLIYLLIK